MSGCGDGAGPEPSASTSSGSSPATTSATPSETPSETVTAGPSPTPTVPVLPEAAKTGDAPGAEAFVRYWFVLANYGIGSGDTAPMLAASDPICEVCRELSADLAGIYQPGGHVEGNQFAVEAVIAPTPNPDGIVATTVTFSHASGTEVHSDGTETQVAAVSEQTLGAVVGYRDGAWAFMGLGTL